MAFFSHAENPTESYFALIKPGHYGVFHQMSKQHLHRYVDGCSFRWEYREHTDSKRRDAAVCRAVGKRLMFKTPSTGKRLTVQTGMSIIGEVLHPVTRIPPIDMSKNLATIALNGEIYLTDFSAAIGCFCHLMDALGNELAPTSGIQWKIEALEVSSAIASVRGIAADKTTEADIEKVIDGYEQTGKAMMDGVTVPYSEPVQKPAQELAKLINGRITSIRFETDTFDAEISSPTLAPSVQDEFEVLHGSVRGRIQSLTSRGTLRFTLYDDFADHAVSCYLKPGSEDIMREAWGKFATVEGMVRRSKRTGRASTVRQVSRVEIQEEGHSDEYREAIGCAPAVHGSISAEEAVRKIRDE